MAVQSPAQVQLRQWRSTPRTKVSLQSSVYLMACATQAPFICGIGPSLTVAIMASPSNVTKAEKVKYLRQVIFIMVESEVRRYFERPMRPGRDRSYGTITSSCSPEKNCHDPIC
jgi:hypothetical protein